MRSFKIFFFLLSSVLLLFAQAPEVDTLPPVPLEPAITGEFAELEYGDVSLAWAGNYIPTTVLFDPGDNRLASGYFGLLNELADRLLLNPDITCELRGFYSPSIDGIDSPSVGEKLALDRALAVREAIIVSQPQLSFRVTFEASGYEITSPVGESPDRFDPRVEMVPRVMRWTPRVIVATESLPYWRRGFRQISKDYGDFLSDMLERNPDLLLCFISGKLDLPPTEAAKRIAVVADRFRRNMDIKGDEQFVEIHCGGSKPGEMIIDLRPVFCSPEPLYNTILWIEPEDYSPGEFYLKLDANPDAEHHLYRVDRSISGGCVPVAWGRNKPPLSLRLDPTGNRPLLLPGKSAFSMTIWRSDNTYERSRPLEFEIGIGKGYYEMGVIPVIPFDMGLAVPSKGWESALGPVVDRICELAESGGSLDVDVIGHSLETEDSADELALERAEYLWQRLSEKLMVEYGKDELAELGRHLAKLSVSIEIKQEVHSVEEGLTSLAPWAHGEILELPRDRFMQLVPFATVKLEFRADE